MSIYVPHLRDEIIIPALKTYDLYSEAAVNLLLGTCAQESRMGYYLKQIKGPALGIYQMEPATELDVFDNVASRYENRKFKWDNFSIIDNFHDPHKDVFKDKLISSLDYATLICRLQYWRFPEALPKADDIEGLAKYWKKYYNTVRGKGHVDDFIKAFETHVSPYLTKGVIYHAV